MVPLQGHGPIRIGICGYENRPLTGQEMKSAMKFWSVLFPMGLLALLLD